MATDDAVADKAPRSHLNERRMIDEPVTPTLVRFSIPLLLTNLMTSLSGTWGAIWVSHVIGPNALTAVVNANLFMGVLTGSIMGVGSAAGIGIGQALGQGNLASVKHFTANAIAFVLTTSILGALLGIVFAPAMIDAIHMPLAARHMAIVYLRVTCLSMPSVFLLTFMMMMLRGAGDARSPFRFSLIAIGLGLVLTPLFLTGRFGFPALGIAGAALAGLISSSVAVLALLTYLYTRNHPLALRWEDRHHLKPDLHLIRMLIARGAPMAGENFIVQGAYFVLLTLVNGQGAATAAAYSAAAQLWGYVQMPSGAVAASMSAMAAINIGAGRWERIDTIALRGCLVSGGFTLLAAALVYALGDLPLRLFLPTGGASLEIARTINYIVLWGWISLAVTNGLSAMVRANSAMLAPTIIYATTMWLFRVPFALILLPALGAVAIWWSFPLGSVSSALLAFAYFRWGGWRKNKLMTLTRAA
jgi:putative MATE family efflux protein